MQIEKSVINRIEDLISKADAASEQYDTAYHEFPGIICSTINIIDLLIDNPHNSYRRKIEDISEDFFEDEAIASISMLSSILNNLLLDIKAGLIYSITNRTRAETFDNFLDHAKSYLSNKQIKESGIIAGVVFEDSIRRICDKHKISQKGRKLDELINELVKDQKISQMKAKRARASAHVRTKATHAQWDEFDERDVQITIDFTEEIILNHLDG